MYYWDDHKADRVRQKHGIELEEAIRVFDDPDFWTRRGLYENADGSFEEQFRTTGIVNGMVFTLASVHRLVISDCG